jgi:hypothetical protein
VDSFREHDCRKPVLIQVNEPRIGARACFSIVDTASRITSDRTTAFRAMVAGPLMIVGSGDVLTQF